MNQEIGHAGTAFKFELSERLCPICGTSHAKEFAQPKFDLSRLDEFAFASRKQPEFMHYRLSECKNCDLVYANPAPNSAALEQAYDSAAFDTSAESSSAARTYAIYLKSILDDLTDRDGALDIGTGDGAFLEELLAAGFRNVQGVEPSEAPIATAKPHLRALIRHAPFRSADYETEQSRLVTCFQTIEHVSNPLELCRDIFRITKPGGAVFLVCHNRRGLLNRVLGEKSPIFDIEHLQLFSPASVRALLEAAGFKNIRVRPIVNRYSLNHWTRMLPIPQGIKTALLRILHSTGAGRLSLALPVGNLAATAFR